MSEFDALIHEPYLYKKKPMLKANYAQATFAEVDIDIKHEQSGMIDREQLSSSWRFIIIMYNFM